MKNAWPFLVAFFLSFWPDREGVADPWKGRERSAGAPAAAFPKERVVTLDDLHAKWREVREGKSRAVLLDVRTPAEFAGGHVPGSVNVTSERPSRILERWPDRDTEIWVFCRTSRRSMKVGSFLRRHGYGNVYVVDDGVPGWARRGFPLDIGER